MIKNFFRLSEHRTNLSTEFFAGLTTFLTMGYIIFLQPAILSGNLSGYHTGMDAGALVTTTCFAAAVACLLMGLLANYPVALAPGMGENFFFITVVAICSKLPGITGDLAWQTALAVVFISGLLFLFITVFGLRRLILESLSPSMQHAIAAGIGLFIAYLGLKNGGVIVANSSGLFMSSDLRSDTILIFFIGFAVTCALKILKFNGHIIWGIIATTVLACLLGKIKFVFPIALPSSPMPVVGKLNFPGVFNNFTALLPLLIIFLFMDIFDTLGTLVGVCSQASLVKDNKIPGVERAFLADALATVFGAFCGHSTVTSYIESASGVEYGGRSGATAIFAGFFFLLAVFFSPLVQMIVSYPGGLNPITAPALVIVGLMMLKNISFIKWDEIGEAAPAFLTLIGIPFTSSISDGLMLGIVSYPIINLLGGRGKEISWTAYLISGLMIAYLLLIKSRI